MLTASASPAQTSTAKKYSNYDVVVIGGGPAGSTLSTFLARKGYTVLVIEREKFPRFHIGESLLPSTQLIWEELGIASDMEQLGNTFKYAGEMRVGLDPRKSDYAFTQAKFNHLPRKLLQERPYGYQVDRSTLDHYLLKNSRKEGVTVIEEASVKKVLWEDDRATGLRWRTKDGTEYITKAACVADCSGRNSLIARNTQMRVPHPTIKTSAIYGHFRNVAREPGIRQGDVQTYFIENGWFWFIPLPNNQTSFGVVMNEPGTLDWSKQNPEKILLNYINRYEFLRERFEQAEQTQKVRILKHLPYYSSRSAGNGWILVGDANFFIDPLFSSGVHVAFHSGKKAAIAIDQFLKRNRDLRPFKKYQTWSKGYRSYLFTTIDFFYKMLKHQFVVENFVVLSNRYIKDGPFRRRIVSWFAGYFENYYWAMRCIWGIIWGLVKVAQVRETLLGKPAWDRSKICTKKPLMIPKAADWDQSEAQSGAQMRRAKAMAAR